MQDATPRLSLPFLAAAQAQKHVTLNESLGRLDTLVQCAVESRSIALEPSAIDGQTYILPPGKTGGSWGPMANHCLACLRDGVWEAYLPAEGWRAFVKDEGVAMVFAGGAWRALAAERVSKAGDTMSGPLTTPQLRVTASGGLGGALSALDGAGVGLSAAGEPRLVIGGFGSGSVFIDDSPSGRMDLRGATPTFTFYAEGAVANRKYVRVNNFAGEFSVDALSDDYGTAAVLMVGERGAGTSWRRLKVGAPLAVRPGASVIPEALGEVTFELTNDTTLTFRAKGADGVVRSASLILG